MPDTSQAGPGYSAELALAHLDRLERIGPRGPGDAADRAARDYLARALDQAGLDVLGGASVAPDSRAEAGRVDPPPLVAWKDGPSPDSVLLVAPYDLSGGTAGVDDAGAAVVLELARALARSDAPYDLVVALVPVPMGGRGAAGASPASRGAALQRAGERLVPALAGAGLAPERVRLAMVLAASMRTGSRIARDLLSPPVPRELVWQIASRMAYADVFAPTERWSSPVGMQTALRAAGMRHVLAIVPSEAPLTAPARTPLSSPGPAAAFEAPPAKAGAGPADEAGGRSGADSEPSAGRTLRAVGEVVHAALLELLARLARLDAFTP